MRVVAARRTHSHGSNSPHAHTQEPTGVDGPKLDALQAGADHSVQGVAAAASDADHLDARAAAGLRRARGRRLDDQVIVAGAVARRRLAAH